MAAIQKNHTKISSLAKDLGLKNKELLDVLTESGIDGKTHSAALEPDEWGLIMDALTQRAQVDSIGDYLDKKVTVPAEEKPAEKKEKAEKAEVKAEEPKAEEAKPEKSAKTKKTAAKAEETKIEEPAKKEAEKAEIKTAAKAEAPKTEAKPETKAEAKPEPKAEAKPEAKPEPKVETKADAPKFDTQKPRDDRRTPGGAPQNRDGGRPQNGERRDFQRNDNRDFQRNDRPQGDFRNSQRPQNGPQNRDGGRPQNGERRDFQRNDNRDFQRNDRPQGGFQRNDNRNQGGFGGGFKDKDSGNERRTPSSKREPIHTYTRGQNAAKNTGESRIVDMRTTTVDLDKYDERLENLAADTGMDTRAQKQKLKKQNTRDFHSQREKERMAMEKMRKQGIERAKKQPLQITVPDEISVGELASRLKITAGEVIKKLMMLGVMASVNEVIDYDTAFLVADELGAKVTKEVVVTIEEKLFDEAEDSEENLEPRSPVVCVMGHVDHGKTSLLDAIRHTNVTSGEAGGITQAIGAYRVNINGRDITFLDTPGHEAFTAMRARGAKSTDIAILVVAADDGIMPQTVEAINHAKAAGIDIVVAINKMDKPTANPDNIKQELTQYELVPEEWGGDVICVPVSALTKMGIDELLENVLLVADMKELKANPNRRAKGLVIEAKLDKGRGPVATVLVQNGTLNAGDIVIAGTSVGRVRAMTDDKGRTVKVAGPSVPVEIIGLAEVPEAGDEFAAVEDERMARELAEQRREKAKDEQFRANAKVNLNDLFAQISEGVKDLNIIVKADVGGSAEAVKQSLQKLTNEEVRVNIIHTAVGGITEGDVMLAAASNALIVGFNVRPDKSAIDKAERESVEIRTYRIIYECIEEVEAAMKGMLAPKFKEVVLGHAEVRQTIHVPNVGTIAGSYVQDGKVSRNAQIRVVRDGVVIFEDKISSLKRFKDDAKEVAQGFECGIGLERFNDIKENDILEAFIMEEVKPQ